MTINYASGNRVMKDAQATDAMQDLDVFLGLKSSLEGKREWSRKRCGGQWCNVDLDLFLGAKSLLEGSGNCPGGDRVIPSIISIFSYNIGLLQGQLIDCTEELCTLKTCRSQTHHRWQPYPFGRWYRFASRWGLFKNRKSMCRGESVTHSL